MSIGNLSKRSPTYFVVIFLMAFSAFVFIYEHRVSQIANKEIREHAHLLANDLWNFNHEGAREYLQLVAESGNFVKISVINNNGEIFQEASGGAPSMLETIGIQLHLVHVVSLVAPIQHANNYIGWIEGYWIPNTLSTHLAVFCFLTLVYLIILLYQNVSSQKRLMEKKVKMRTADLLKAKTTAEKISMDLRITGTELQALLDNSPVGILFVDFNRIIKRVNREVTEITGYSQQELVGSSTRLLYASQEIFNKVGEDNYPVLDIEGFCEAKSELQRKDGHSITCYLRGKRLGSENEIDGVLWSIEDITLKLKMEQELLKIRKLESIGVLAGGIAHDFNNILMAIIGNISLAEMISTENEKLTDLLSSAKKASLRAKDLTGRLLTFSGGGEPVRITGSLPKLLRESASFVLSGSNVKCSFDFQDNLWAVLMDKSQISQVIQNLVMNADQSMKKGGTITISSRNIESNHNMPNGLSAGRYVCVTVRDSGSGIAEEHFDKIFDPYYSTKKKDANKGSGLGLAVVHSIVSKHEGVITVDSTEGEGSAFHIYLPASENESTDEVVESSESLPFGNGRILIMDDEETVLEVASEMLNFLGYKHETAKDGAEAVALYCDFFDKGMKFDAVIMDLTIPGGMGGAETVTKLLDFDPEVKAIVSSGYSSEAVLKDIERSGFCAMVLKPYQVNDLGRVLSEVLSPDK